MLGIHTNKRWKINKGSKDQTDASTLSHDKASNVWKNNAISFTTKIKLCKSLGLSTLLYGCESWTLTADPERRIQAFGNKCYRRMLGTWHAIQRV